jgi:hypothetical protein
MALLCLAVLAMVWFRLFRFRERVQRPVKDKVNHPTAAVSTLAALYLVFSTFLFVAWYRKHYPLSKYKWGGDGWMGPTTYAGGADKCGHAFATMALARLGTFILNGIGGFARRKASIVSAIMSELLFVGVEVKDGFYYEFSFSDLTGDTTGMLMALALDNSKRLEELFAYRVDYFPSEMYYRQVGGTAPCRTGGCSRWNIAEDYSGQTYLTALHLKGIKAVRNKIGRLADFVDVVGGFDSRGYRPYPTYDLTTVPRQQLFMGLSFNAQGFSDWLFGDRKSNAAERARQVLHGIFEVFNLPNTTLPLVGTKRFGKLRLDQPRVPSEDERPWLPSATPGVRGPFAARRSLPTPRRQLLASAPAQPATTRSRSR